MNSLVSPPPLPLLTAVEIRQIYLVGLCIGVFRKGKQASGTMNLLILCFNMRRQVFLRMLHRFDEKTVSDQFNVLLKS
jgi:hypothetical protein